MRIIEINKFLFRNGGSETYIFKLGEALEQHGHEVQYFGMEHEGRCVGNRVNAYTSDMDFHGGSKLSKLTYPIKTIYSKEARVQLRKVLDDFQPDVCHLNNFNYQLTPSIILEIVKWRKETGRDCKIIFTAHDYQLVCPNHMLNNPNTHQNCEKCLGGHFVNCMKGKLLITAGVYESDVAEKVQDTFEEYRETQNYKEAILSTANTLQLSKASVTSYLPYQKGVYFPSTADKEKISVGAERQRRYRAVRKLRTEPTEEHLWEVVLLYAGVRFKTYSGLAWLMARHADPANVPDSPEEFLDQFNTFSIYQILPQLIELWGLNVQTEVESRKNLEKVSGK